MPVFFQMTCSGLNSINKRALPEISQKLLLNIAYSYGQTPLTKEQLLALLNINRKIISRLLYKIILSGWLVNIEEDDAVAIIKNNELNTISNNKANNTYNTNNADNTKQSLYRIIDTEKHSILLSDREGLVVASSGFSEEQSLFFAAQSTELAKQYLSESDPSESDQKQSKETPFPIFSQMNGHEFNLDCRLIQITGLFFIVTTIEKTALNEAAYFNLMTHLLRRYA